MNEIICSDCGKALGNQVALSWHREGVHGADRWKPTAFVLYDVSGQPTERPRSSTRPSLGPVGTHLRHRGRRPGQAPKTGSTPPMAEADGETDGRRTRRIRRRPGLNRV